ncbi:MAG TPA: HAD-IA family hydrolase [Thermoplasmata archaeon]|nr:MAG: HAD family hydrolase [Euryarchaeota archaeon]HTD80881.1 HAD-IA family hydrolase [Thermoplasmata archaeon]
MLALLLDIDGTLVDTFDLILEAMNVAIAEAGVEPLRAEDLRPLIGMPVEVQMKLLRDMVGPDVQRIADRYYEVFHGFVDRGLRLYPGVKETLERVKDHPIATMSTRRREEARHMLRVTGIDRYFRAIVGGDEVARPKPSPDLPLHAAKALRVPPSRAAVVGDSPVDVQAGRAAGTWTIAATYGYGDLRELQEAKPHAEIARFSDLPAVLGALEAGASRA